MTSLLLDTHVVIWFLEKDPQLSQATLEKIEFADQVFVSSLAVAEISIKVAKGKLTIVPDYIDFVRAAGFEELPLTYKHARNLQHLPFIHSDPFDRLLVAQALCEGLTIVTRDAHIPRYDIKTIRA